MATSCYFELDRCEVFLGNDALVNVNWQNYREPLSTPMHSMRPKHIVTQGSGSLRAATTEPVDNVIDW